MLTRPDFDDSFLELTSHRPWPLPARPWMMTQTWHDLLFAHWPVKKDVLAKRIPPPFELDVYGGDAWVGIIPFYMTNVAPRGVPALPGLSSFAELNLRTYVTAEDKPGVYFFSLDAANFAAVATARTLFDLPYYWACMTVQRGEEWIQYASRRRHYRPAAEFVGEYRPVGPVQEPAPRTLDHFLTERYCLYTVDRRSRPYRLEIHHRPWPLQPAELVLSVNTLAAAHALPLPPHAPILHFSRRQDMVAWPPERM